MFTSGHSSTRMASLRRANKRHKAKSLRAYPQALDQLLGGGLFDRLSGLVDANRRSVAELVVQADAHDVVGKTGLRGDGSGEGRCSEKWATRDGDERAGKRRRRIERS